MDTDRFGQKLEVVYRKGLFWDHFFFLTIFIDGIDEEVFFEIFKFADDTIIASQVNTLNDIISMQRTLDKLAAWASGIWIAM